MTRSQVQIQKGREQHGVNMVPLPTDETEPIAYMVSHIEAGKPIEGLTAIGINVKVIRIIEVAKQSIATGRQVRIEPEHITRP